MREMTTAEFAKANLAAMEEPVAIRRYTKTVGVYYPAGVEPVPLNGPTQLVVPTDELVAASQVINDLEDEIKHLKQKLAAKAVPVAATRPATSEDPFAGLGAQDRAFFDRKLGTGKKKS